MTGVAERLSPREPDSAPAPFHLGDGWFDAWDAAYLAAGQRPVVIGGARLVDLHESIGPVPIRVRRARTNQHSVRFDVDGELPTRDRLLADRDVVTIDYLPEDSRLLAAARGWPATRMRIAEHARAPVADCRGSYAAWLARRSKRIRQRWPKLEAQATRDLGLRFERITRFPDLPVLLAEIFALERAGWKGRERTAIADSAADTRFYTALATRAAAADALRIAVLRDGARIVAFEFGVVGGDRLFALKVAYDERLEAASIGHVLAAMHVRACCEDATIAWYDQLGNGLTPAPYKLRYADRIEPRYRITLYAPTWRGELARVRDGARLRAKAMRDAWRARRAPQ